MMSRGPNLRSLRGPKITRGSNNSVTFGPGSPNFTVNLGPRGQICGEPRFYMNKRLYKNKAALRLGKLHDPVFNKYVNF